MDKKAKNPRMPEPKGPILLAFCAGLTVYVPAGIFISGLMLGFLCFHAFFFCSPAVFRRRLILCFCSAIISVMILLTGTPIVVSADLQFQSEVDLTAYQDSVCEGEKIISFLALPDGIKMSEMTTDCILYKGESATANFFPSSKKINKIKLENIRNGSGLWGVRAQILRRAKKAVMQFPEHTRGVFWALFTGRKDLLSGLCKRWFVKAGLPHVLALSGMHILIWTVLISALLWPVPWKSLRFVLFVLMLGFLLFLTSVPDSLVRAFMGALILQFLLLTGKKIKALDLLCLVFTLQCLIFPSAQNQIGFQLSYAACAGLILVANPVARGMGFLPKFFRKPLATGYGAMCFSSLISIPAFGMFSIHSLYLTPVAGIFCAFVWAGGLVCTFVLSMCPALGILVKWYPSAMEVCLDFCFRFQPSVLILNKPSLQIFFCLLWILPALLTSPEWIRSFFHVDIRRRFLDQGYFDGKRNGSAKKLGPKFSHGSDCASEDRRSCS